MSDMTAAVDDDDDKPEKLDRDENDRLIALALAEYEECQKAVSKNREDQVDDLRFRAGSPDNGWQWPEQVRTSRTGDPTGARPCLTVNKVKTHVAQIVNDIRQNRPSIKVIPVDDGADVDVAEMLNGIIRHIQYVSDADIAYDTAVDLSVTAGEGYIRVLTDYVDDNSFDQDVVIRRVRNMFTVFPDNNCVDPCCTDARKFFVVENMTQEEFEDRWPDASPIDWDFVGVGMKASWFANDRVRVAEWWRVELEKKTLKLWSNGAKTLDNEPVPPVMIGEAPPTIIKKRSVNVRKVIMRRINGVEVLETNEWAGSTIPIVRVVGDEYDIEGEVYVSGLIRNTKDAQRMYNYHCSLEVEQIALAPKAPYVGAAGQFEGHEDQWKTANVVNYAYLEYEPIVDEASGRAFPAPQRQMPPMPSQAIMQAKLGAADDIKSVTGQYDAAMGQRSNETSGIAIRTRDHQSETSTFNYVDNLTRAIRAVGRIIVEIIPKIYDTPRIARMLGEDGSVDQAKIDPSIPTATQQMQSPDGKIAMLYNPTIGKYDVMVNVGPSYSTKRQESVEAMTQMTQANPQLWQVIGDLLVKNMDWPGAEDMAKRLKATLLPQVQALDKPADGGAPPMPPEAQQAMQQAMQHMQQMQQAIQQLQQENQNLKFDQQAKTVEGQTSVQVAQIQAWAEVTKAESELAKAKAQGVDPDKIDAIAGALTAIMSHINPAAVHGLIPAEPDPVPVDPAMQPMQPPSGGFFTPSDGQATA